MERTSPSSSRYHITSVAAVIKRRWETEARGRKAHSKHNHPAHTLLLPFLTFFSLPRQINYISRATPLHIISSIDQLINTSLDIFTVVVFLAASSFATCGRPLHTPSHRHRSLATNFIRNWNNISLPLSPSRPTPRPFIRLSYLLFTGPYWIRKYQLVPIDPHRIVSPVPISATKFHFLPSAVLLQPAQQQQQTGPISTP